MHQKISVAYIYPTEGLHFLGSRLEPQGSAAYPLFLPLQFFSKSL